ncbi:Gypsy retrotransposon integrase-like protein 1 [Paramarasmius palmivorus]|uniref:Gypsy retrotransposon integrase-like protein 1 n=1 Tax=Paramarasmius palmivorus TaxID=297713 RepID=A0AAW0BAF9_9AGAR
MEEGKKQRQQNACDACRRRKVRCDSAGDICSNCASLQMECTHTFEKKKRGPKGPSTKRTTTQRSLVNSVLSSSFVLPSDPGVIHKMLVDLAKFAKSLDRRLSSLRLDVRDLESASPADLPQAPDEDNAEDNRDEVDALTSSLKSLILTSNRHLGKSSYFVFLQSTVQKLGADRDDGYLRRVFTSYQRPECWIVQPWQRILTTTQDHQPLDFPPQPLLQTLIHTYFTTTNTLFPLLHRQTFEHAVACNLHLHHRPFGYVVLGLCAVASRQVYDPGVLASESWYSAGWKFFSQIPVIKGNLMDQPTVEDVQICVLSALFLQLTSTSDAVWTIVGLGIRHCQEIGVSSSRTSSPPQHEQQLLRAYWILKMIDIFMGVILGRSSDGDIPPQEPEPEGEGGEEDGNLAFFQTYCKLVKIVRSVQGLYTSKSISKPKLKQDTVIELDSALNQFTNNIPLHLQYTNAKTSTNYTLFWQATILKVMAHWVEIHVHRVAASSASVETNNSDNTKNADDTQDGTTDNDTHRTILLSAARSIVHILEALHERTEREGRQSPPPGPGVEYETQDVQPSMDMWLFGYGFGYVFSLLLNGVSGADDAMRCVDSLPEETTGDGADRDAFVAGLAMEGLNSGVQGQVAWF